MANDEAKWDTCVTAGARRSVEYITLAPVTLLQTSVELFMRERPCWQPKRHARDPIAQVGAPRGLVIDEELGRCAGKEARRAHNRCRLARIESLWDAAWHP